ncbi:MAG: hypothetical protein ACI9BF_000218 [Candidatus Paceibacteria bacterium]|jgi:hypothetical protein
MNAKNIVVAVLALVLIGAVSYLMLNSGEDNVVVVQESETEVITETPEITEEDLEPIQEIMTEERGADSVIGESVNGSDIVAYHFGTGENEILLVGGTHGSYSPNTSAVTEEAVTYFQENTDTIPESVTLTIIPNLNPDGLVMSGTEGRFNANNVDINRNFDCEWSATGVWRDQKVSGGSEAFSEPEAKALQDYIETNDPNVAIVWFSAEGKVYPSACDKAPSKASVELAETFATAAGYPAAAEFNAYAITGDMVNWMAGQGIPAISVLLTDHKNTEWTKNIAGIKAVLNTYAE